MSFSIKSGDLEPPLRAQLLDSGGDPIDVSTGYTITVRVLDVTADPPTLEGYTLAQPVPEPNVAEPLIIGSLGWVEHLWVSPETVVTEDTDYQAEFIATLIAGARPRTFPSSAFAAFTIEAILATGALPDSIKWGEVVDLFADANDVSDTYRQAILTYVNTTFNTKLFTAPRLKLLRLNLAAHHATLQVREDGPGGPVNSEKVDEVEVRYAAFSTGDPLLGRTPFGLTVKSLIRCSKARGPFVI